MIADQITRTARQVRLPGRQPIHVVDEFFRSGEHGNGYTTRCGQTFTVAGAAVLTTDPASCRTCEVRA